MKNKEELFLTGEKYVPIKKKDKGENNDGSTACTSETFLNLED